MKLHVIFVQTQGGVEMSIMCGILFNVTNAKIIGLLVERAVAFHNAAQVNGSINL